jgi:hypothetical protein
MTSTGFGWVKYNDHIYETDILILADGTVRPRNEAELTRKFGTMHAIDVEEIKFLLQEMPEVIVIGSGQNGEARLTQGAKNFIKGNGIRVMEGISPKAVKTFDSLTERKAALIHVTC